MAVAKRQISNEKEHLVFLWAARELRGKTVRLKASLAKSEEFDPSETAVVLIELSDTNGGVKLRHPLAGHLYWNIADLCLAKAKEKESSSEQ